METSYSHYDQIHESDFIIWRKLCGHVLIEVWKYFSKRHALFHLVHVRV